MFHFLAFGNQRNIPDCCIIFSIFYYAAPSSLVIPPIASHFFVVLFPQKLEYLLKPGDIFFGLFQMINESHPQFLRRRGFLHF